MRPIPTISMSRIFSISPRTAADGTAPKSCKGAPDGGCKKQDRYFYHKKQIHAASQGAKGGNGEGEKHHKEDGQKGREEFPQQDLSSGKKGGEKGSIGISFSFHCYGRSCKGGGHEEDQSKVDKKEDAEDLSCPL